ncbi:MAG TPA: NADH-quinone oxidoreductase subunit NuoH [Candidatus Aminicenantes bacterium]|nr:NADH-quinone oxidoreductase subunit NuoH [Candidatus Aminicenantes bacterium]
MLHKFIFELLIPLVKIAVAAIFPLLMVVLMVWFERRVVGFIQARQGPNRVGWFGILQPVADTVKLFFKEDIMQCGVDRLLFNIAPVIVLFSSLLAFCFIPLGGTMQIGTYNLNFWVSESPVGLLLVMSISSLSIFALIFGAWASNSKYPLLGGLRSVVQILSYEIPLSLSVLSIIFFSRSMNMVDIVRQQEQSGVWYGFLLPVAFVVFWISAVAETNRAPFDLPEGESELVGGFHTEYSGMKFAYFFMAEYTHMVLIASLTVTLFFGGWLPPFPNVAALRFLHLVPGFCWYFAKIMFFLYLFVWIRGTFPRYRFDELIKLAWKWLVPLAFLNLLVVALLRIGR